MNQLEILLEELKSDNERLRNEINQLTEERLAIQNSERAVTCVFCGMVYPPGTPPSNHAVLVAHVEECPKHPMRQYKLRALAAEAYLHTVRPALTLGDASDDDLKTMKGVMIGAGSVEMIPVIDAELEYRRFQKDN